MECCTPGFYLRITESRGLTLLSGFEGIDGGKAATPEYGIDPLDCEIVNLDALIECDLAERFVDRFREVEAGLDQPPPLR